MGAMAEANNAWTHCHKEEWYQELTNTSAGFLDKNVTYAYVKYSTQTELPLKRGLTFLYNASIDLSLFYETTEIGACYGTLFDPAKVDAAWHAQDLCLLTLKSAGGCAPGWTSDAFVDALFCLPFRECTRNFEFWKNAYLEMGAKELPLTPENISIVTFPAGWHDVKTAEAAQISQSRTAAAQNRRASGDMFRAVNSVYLASAVVAIVLLVIGGIAGLAGQNPGRTVGFRRALPSLKAVGASTVFVGALGFMIYNIAFLREIGHLLPSARSLWFVPGAGNILYNISTAVSLLSGIEIVAIIGLAIFSVAGRKQEKQVVTFVWSVVCVIFTGPLIASAVGISVSSAINGDLTQTVEWYHSSNYNRSGTVSGYVNETGKLPPHPPQKPLPVDSGDCVPTDQWFEDLIKFQPGEADDWALFYYAYSVPDHNPPWTNATNVTWDDPPGWDTLYATASTTGCYNTVLEPLSIARAHDHRDLCRLKLRSASGCGPGWDRALFDDILCTQFTKCRAAWETNMAKWDTFEGVNVTHRNATVSFELLPGWNALDKLEAFLKKEAVSELTTALLTSPDLWLVFNASILSIGAVGWLLLVAGIIAAAAVGPVGELAGIPGAQSLSSAPETGPDPLSTSLVS
jgi:hypothetical protein